LSNPAGELSEAHATSREQAQLADAMLRRLAGPVDSDLRGRPVVLVVDDSLEAREATATLLEQAGFRAVTAANGVEALIVAHYARPVVALLDLMMPILDGLQTARLLSESPSTRQVKVVAYSGRADMFSRRLPGTFTAILAKPTTPEELLALVHQQASIAGRN
jgi:CheY-like chemotaxis protein